MCVSGDGVAGAGPGHAGRDREKARKNTVSRPRLLHRFVLWVPGNVFSRAVCPLASVVFRFPRRALGVALAADVAAVLAGVTATRESVKYHLKYARAAAKVCT